MTFELTVFKIQGFAVKLQSKTPGPFLNNVQLGLGALLTQFLMGMCFAKVLTEGQKQWQTQRRVKTAKRK